MTLSRRIVQKFWEPRFFWRRCWLRHHGREAGGRQFAIALLANTLATGATLVTLIFTFGPISGAHFNPAVTLADASQGGIGWSDAPAYVLAQVLGAFIGVGAAHLMFGEALIQVSQHARAGGGQLFSEFVATFGLLCVIWGCVRLRSEAVPVAVGLSEIQTYEALLLRYFKVAYQPDMKRTSLTRFAWLSIAAAVLTIGLKTTAWRITGSVGLLSDAMESVVNLVGGVMALAMLTVAQRPADEDHPYGHGKAEYFSSGVEGTLILIAAVSIGVTAVDRLIAPKPLEEIGIGLAVSIAASLVNLGVALLLLRVGRKSNSITLEANAHHLLTDVWTSVGVVVGVGMVALTGWQRLDPIVALVVAANIIWTGVRIVRRSIGGLMDAALPAVDQAAVQEVLKSHRQAGVKFHALRTRQAGARKFISLHVLVPGDWTVQRGHQLLERIEDDIRQAVRDSTVFTHLESLDDPASWNDETLDRWLNAPGPKDN